VHKNGCYTAFFLILKTNIILKHQACQAPVVHAYNSSYSGSRDQEDDSLKPAWANKKPITK
jgi:hypothetical protein